MLSLLLERGPGVAQTIPRCVNHPDVETRLSCTSCDAPICTRCMRPAAVGQKCPSCARQPRSALAVGKPEHYLKGGGAGLVVAVAGGLLLSIALGRVGFGGIILPALLGFGVGRAVRWGAQHQTAQPFRVLAGVLGAFGGVLAGGGLAVLGAPFALLGVAAAAYFAIRGLYG
jgi:hypothetical protein